MAAGRILVVAPNPDFRRSLAFALETEGYSVETEGEIPSEVQLGRFGVIVLDHKALRREPPERTIRVGNTVPVVLLASRPQDWLAENAFRTIPTPLMGNVLSDAVADALAVPLRDPTK